MTNRILACLLLVAALWLIPHGQARADSCVLQAGRSYIHCANPSEAYNKVQSFNPAPSSYISASCDASTGVTHDAYYDEATHQATYRFHCGSSGWFVYATAISDTGCPSGSAWNSTSHTCAISCPAGVQEDPDNPGTCLTDAKCQARNASLGLGSDNVVRTWTSICQAGCTYQLQNAHHITGSTGLNAYRGSMYVSGTCGANAPTDALAPNNTSPKTHPIPEPPQCTPAGGGQTFCIQPDGRQCASASTGRQVCWTPNETGEKTDQNTLQKRCNGASCPDLPDTPPPPSDTFTKGPTTTTTDTPPTGSPTTTTITNYTTGSGGPAGSGNTGCSSSTSGGCAPNGTASGGGDCDTPPIVSDPALSMVATQAWATRCAVTAGNTVKVTGDIGNCGAAFTVEGADTDANVQKLRGMRAQICGTGTNPDGHDSTGAVNAANGDGTGAASSVVFDGDGIGTDGLDTTGLGFGNVCPSMPVLDVMGAHIDLNLPVMCNWMRLGGAFVMALTALLCLRALGRAAGG